MNVGFVLVQTIEVFALVLRFLFIARIFASIFFRLRPGFGAVAGIINVLYALTEPILAPIREMIHRSPVSRVGHIVDFSPIFAFVIINMLTVLLVDIVILLPI